jgi:hypothetical protein
MKKSIVMLVVMLICVSAAQRAFSQAQVAIGIKGGVNMAKVDASDVPGSLKNKTGFHAGAFGLVKLANIGIQPEIIFSQQGAKLKTDVGNFDANIDYINIPVVVKFYLAAGLNLQVGPQFGFLSRAEIDGQDQKESFKNSDISAALGAGWDLPFGLTLDARYNLGLSKIDEDDAAFSAAKNQVFQISVGYKLFKFGH